MKLRELSKDVKHAIDDVYEYAFIYQRNPTLSRSVDLLLKRNVFVYKGPMYRTHMFDVNLLGEHMNNKRKILQAVEPRDNNYHSWSKTVNEMVIALRYNHDAGLYDEFPRTIGVVFKQIGQGVDVVKAAIGAGYDKMDLGTLEESVCACEARRVPQFRSPAEAENGQVEH